MKLKRAQLHAASALETSIIFGAGGFDVENDAMK